MTKIKVRGKWFVDTKAHPTVTPPIRERVEPVGYANRYADGFSMPLPSAEQARQYAYQPNIETAVPLYRHPATPDDAIALLVREGWVEEVRGSTENDSRGTLFQGVDSVTPYPVRVLIAPTPERAS